MLYELPLFSNTYQLIEMGGLPVAIILCLSILIFGLFFERLYYLGISFKQALPKLKDQLNQEVDMNIWEKQQLHNALVSDAILSTQRALWLLKASIVACPLVGLMGTVSGMILVFDQISLTGTGNPRVMASGIFHATLPTMAGMLISIVGLIMQYILRRFTLSSQNMLNESLPVYHEYEESRS